VLALLCWAPAPAAAQEIRGRVVADEDGAPVADVSVTLLDGSGRPMATAVTDTAGRFRLAPRAAGVFTLHFVHLAYAPYSSAAMRIHAIEVVTLEVRLARSVHAMEPLTVTARASIHDATYEGLYARIPRSPPIGHNRILVKGDWELHSALTVGDVIRHHFIRVHQRLGGACLYWNGRQQPPAMTAILLDRHTDDLEALEVYRTYLSAPMTMWGPPLRPFQPTCGAVVAIWSLRPDLPGRAGPDVPEPDTP
jgi:5-hydroxyisourate hydrolase-like protein (transthyretin family)